jgi:hypothetical protein
MKSTILVWMAVTSAFGCASSRHAPASGAAAKAANPDGGLSSATAPALPPPLDAPREIACEIAAAGWPSHTEYAGGGHRFLRFARGGRPFADVDYLSDIKVRLPVAPVSAGGTVMLNAGGIYVEGLVEAHDIQLYAASPFVVSGVFVPNEEHRMDLRSAMPGSVTLIAHAGPSVRSLGTELVAERPCTDVSMGSVAIDAKAIDRVMGPPNSAMPESPHQYTLLRPGKIPLSSTPDGDAIVEIDSIQRSRDPMLIFPVRVLSVQNDSTRIALRAEGGVLFGWVASARLRTVKGHVVDLSHDCPSSYRGIRIPRTDESFVACDREIPLVAEVGGERRLVGVVHRGVRFKRVRSVTGWAEVQFLEKAVTAADGASFWLRESELADCSSAKALQADGP